MQQEDFYRRIQEKMSHLDDNSEWNKDDVWRRINRQETAVVVARRRNLWVYAAAASVVIALSIGLVLMNQTTEKQFVSDAVTNRKISDKIEQFEAAKVQVAKGKIAAKTSLVADNQDVVQNENVSASLITNNTEIKPQIVPKDNSVTETPEPVVNTVAQNIEKTIEEPKQTVAEALSEEQPAVEAQFQGGKVVVLNIPVAEEEDRGKKKRNVLTKIFKKDSNKPERTDKIWAFVKESFRNDSIEKKDSVR